MAGSDKQRVTARFAAPDPGQLLAFIHQRGQRARFAGERFARSQAARHLVFPGGADAAVSDPSQERRIRLIFRSAQTTAIPMVARLAAEESIYANVISASTQKLSEEVYGSMLLGIPNSQFDRAWQFFRTIPNLQAEEVSVDVQ